MGMSCPKCAYERQPADSAPDWQCPGCGVAYNKVQAQHSVDPGHSRPEVHPVHAPSGDDDVGEQQGKTRWLVMIFGGERWRWKWLCLLLLLVGAIDMARRYAHEAAAPSEPTLTPYAIPQTYDIGVSGYKWDRQRLGQFEETWDAAIKEAVEANRARAPGDFNSAAFRTALSRLTDLQHRWNIFDFRTSCYRRSRHIYADALLLSKEDVERYATLEISPAGWPSRHTFERYYAELNACLPLGQKVDH